MDIPIQSKIPLSTLSTFGIGGLAKQLIYVDSPLRLIEAITWSKNHSLPFRIFAGGSNIVFPDEGTRDLLIRFVGGSIEYHTNTLIVDAGVNLMDTIRSAISHNLQGLETLSGIPGTVGGAIVGNAGAYGHSISECVENVEVLDGEKRCWITKSECNFHYRHSMFKEKPLVVLRIQMGFKPGNAHALEKISQDIIHIREKKYKPGLKCPGSFFKNVLVENVTKDTLARIDQEEIIEGKIPAGYLLSEVGARNMQIGGVKIASFHGNLFINQGNGTAQDVKKLAQILKKRVKDRFAINLREEIRYF